MDESSRTDSNAITLRIKFKSVSIDEFTMRYGADVSPGGIFIKTKQPLEVGTNLQFEFSLTDGTPLLFGTGTVAWIRENDPSRPTSIPGMGLRFDKLTIESQQAHKIILEGKAKLSGRPSPTPPPPSSTAKLSPTPPPPSVSHPLLSTPPAPTMFKSPSPATAVSGKTTASFASPFSPVAASTPAAPVVPGPSAVPTPVSAKEVSDEFGDGNKTEIAGQPPSFYFDSVESTKMAAKSDDGAVASPFDDQRTDASAMPDLSAKPPVDLSLSDMDLPLSPSPVSPLDRPGPVDTANRGSDGEAPQEVLPELSAGTALEDLSQATPLEVPSEKTTETSLLDPAVCSAPTVSMNPILDKEPGDRAGFASPPTPAPKLGSAGDASVLADKPRGSTKFLLIAALLAAGVAFGGVYLWKTKPWETPATPAPAVTPVAPPVAPTPPVVPAEPAKAEPEKPAMAEPVKAEEPKKEEAPAKAETPKTVESPAKVPEPKKEEAPAKAEAPKKEDAPKPEKKTAKPERRAPEAAVVKTDTPAATEEKAAESFKWSFRSVPSSAEVLIDGEYFCRTPCERRVLDPTKPAVITMRKTGFESFEWSLTGTESFTKKGKESILTVTGKLPKIKAKTEGSEGAAPAGEAKPAGETKPAGEAKSTEPAPAETPKSKPAPEF